MYRLFNTSKSGMIANQSKIENIGNNISNVNTTGYKKLDTQFSDLVSETLNRSSYPTNSRDSQRGTGVKLSDPVRNLAQGTLKQTDISSDLGIDGDGFFRVVNKDGENVYTRNGEFSVDGFGRIVDMNGNLLEINFEEGMDYNNSNIRQDNLSISKDGQVIVDEQLIGTINLYKPSGNDSFLSNGDGTFSLVDGAQVILADDASIIQGTLEMSNVSLQDEMVELIKAQRAFQLSSKGINVADEMWSLANNLKSS